MLPFQLVLDFSTRLIISGKHTGRLLLVLACLMPVVSCHRPPETSGICEVLNVDVVDVSYKPLEYVVTDPDRIRKLITFANARREASRPTRSPMPTPRLSVALYDKTKFVGAIGSGSNFLYVGCPDWEGNRPATEPEVAEFERLGRPSN
jgi:hypothetical protein